VLQCEVSTEEIVAVADPDQAFGGSHIRGAPKKSSLV